METVLKVGKQAQWLAGTAATIATLLFVGGSLVLAEYYARTGGGVEMNNGSLAQHAGKPASRPS